MKEEISIRQWTFNLICSIPLNHTEKVEEELDIDLRVFVNCEASSGSGLPSLKEDHNVFASAGRHTVANKVRGFVDKNGSQFEDITLSCEKYPEDTPFK